jgi:Smg protein
VGFEAEEIQDALRWLDGLASSAESVTGSPVQGSIRIYTAQEREVLSDESLGFITFLESAGVLPAPMREMVLDRAMAVGNGPMDLEDLKIIVLMVFWSLGEEPDALILDELFVDSEDRVIH